MRILAAFGVLALFGAPAFAAAQEEEMPSARSLEERLERARQDYFKLKLEEDRSTDLWYGTPGVRPGGDLLGPIVDLVRKPSGLLDFRPRPVPRYLPDRETAEFLRERR